jgi:hypothetical protein
MHLHGPLQQFRSADGDAPECQPGGAFGPMFRRRRKRDFEEIRQSDIPGPQPVGQPLLQPYMHQSQGGEDHVPLGAEIVGKHPGGAACLSGDVDQRDRVEALLGDRLARRQCDFLPALGVINDLGHSEIWLNRKANCAGCSYEDQTG